MAGDSSNLHTDYEYLESLVNQETPGGDYNEKKFILNDE